MHVYTIQQILDVRPLYRDPPYPGFSLDEACHRKKMTQTKLVRGPNAWVVRGSAKTSSEWVERLVQGSLNKLSEANFDVMVAKLQTNMIFATEEAMKKTVSLIFTKALEEPENSKSYAGVCYKLAEYEVGMSAALQPSDGKKHSKLRNAVVGVAQEEFQSRRKMPPVDGLSKEEIEQQRITFMRRKRANMKFVGELFMHKVLSHNTMMQIIHTIMQEAEKGGYPTSEDIEFLTELFLTIGERLDAVPELRAKIDSYFKLLERLKDQKEVYPPRIRFKILDLIELRRDLCWEPRAAKTPASASRGGGDKTNAARPTSATNAANTPTSSGRRAKQSAPAFPASPHANSEGNATSPTSTTSAAATTNNNNNNNANRSWRNVIKSPSAAGPVSGLATLRASGAEASVTFEARVRSLLQEWAAECTNDFIPEWMNEFRNCSRNFESESALCKAAAAEVVREACMTTRKEAQREASGFLIVGLYLTDEEVFDGFAMALASAIEDGILVDVPKFSERFIQMLRITSGEDAVADVYYDTAKVLCRAYGFMAEPDEMALDTLMEFWGRIPKPPADGNVVLPLPVVQSLAEMPAAGQEPLAGRIIASLYTIGLVECDTVREWLALPLSGICANVAEEFNKTMSAVDA